MSGKDTFRHGKFFNKKTKQWQEMVGSKFGRLTVLRWTGQKVRPCGNAQAIWECICECGNVVQRNHSCLTQKQTVSCGCWSAEKISLRRRKPDTAFQDLWHSYKKGARERGLEWTLTEDQFRGITSSPCHYTGRLPAQEAHSCTSNRKIKKGLKVLPGGIYLYNGIDRLDNSKGYISDNCVPCCEVANFSKRVMTHDEFIALCKEVTQHFQISVSKLGI